MGINGDQWGPMGINGDQWGSMGINGDQWGSIGINGDQWGSMGINAWNTFVLRVEHPYIVRKSEKVREIPGYG